MAERRRVGPESALRVRTQVPATRAPSVGVEELANVVRTEEERNLREEEELAGLQFRTDIAKASSASRLDAMNTPEADTPEKMLDVYSRKMGERINIDAIPEDTLQGAAARAVFEAANLEARAPLVTEGLNRKRNSITLAVKEYGETIVADAASRPTISPDFLLQALERMDAEEAALSAESSDAASVAAKFSEQKANLLFEGGQVAARNGNGEVVRMVLDNPNLRPTQRSQIESIWINTTDSLQFQSYARVRESWARGMDSPITPENIMAHIEQNKFISESARASLMNAALNWVDTHAKAVSLKSSLEAWKGSHNAAYPTDATTRAFYDAQLDAQFAASVNAAKGDDDSVDIWELQQQVAGDMNYIPSGFRKELIDGLSHPGSVSDVRQKAFSYLSLASRLSPERRHVFAGVLPDKISSLTNTLALHAPQASGIQVMHGGVADLDIMRWMRKNHLIPPSEQKMITETLERADQANEMIVEDPGIHQDIGDRVRVALHGGGFWGDPYEGAEGSRTPPGIVNSLVDNILAVQATGGAAVSIEEAIGTVVGTFRKSINWFKSGESSPGREESGFVARNPQMEAPGVNIYEDGLVSRKDNHDGVRAFSVTSALRGIFSELPESFWEAPGNEGLALVRKIVEGLSVSPLWTNRVSNVKGYARAGVKDAVQWESEMEALTQNLGISRELAGELVDSDNQPGLQTILHVAAEHLGIEKKHLDHSMRKILTGGNQISEGPVELMFWDGAVYFQEFKQDRGILRWGNWPSVVSREDWDSAEKVEGWTPVMGPTGDMYQVQMANREDIAGSGLELGGFVGINFATQEETATLDYIELHSRVGRITERFMRSTGVYKAVQSAISDPKMAEAMATQMATGVSLTGQPRPPAEWGQLLRRSKEGEYILATGAEEKELGEKVARVMESPSGENIEELEESGYLTNREAIASEDIGVLPDVDVDFLHVGVIEGLRHNKQWMIDHGKSFDFDGRSVPLVLTDGWRHQDSEVGEKQSKHKKGTAWDVRCWGMTTEEKIELARYTKQALGSNVKNFKFEYRYDDNHCHFQYEE